ncbi:MAG: lactoylglutathione lyase [Actinomycetota bacterium]|nr:lactoylglutathione lyase [Actinomycetota bacterium]
MEITLVATGIVVRDLAAAQHFYETALGMKETNRVRVDSLGLDEVILASAGGGAALVLMRYDDGRAHVEVGQKLVFTVPDPAAVAAAAVGAGGSVLFPATEMPEFGATIAFVQDPDGHGIEVLDRSVA